MSAVPADDERAKIPPLTLFRAFMSIGLSGFGGVLPFARRELVDRRNWMTDTEFAEMLGVAQVLPGPNIINISVWFGTKHAGALGAIAAFTGLCGVPLVMLIAIATLYGRYAGAPRVGAAVDGMASAAAGLIIGTGITLFRRAKPNYRSSAVLALVFVAAAFLRVPLLLIIAVAAPLGVFAAGKRA
ncbi:chromate transporter [Roseiterribacter gracilis]|uniref:Chromate transporter n=1 Tax=Roseiterribacter gracilis TaxID=2812848 RepID=A0A8S8XAZ9_9PROT|nr:chromate transporter [Rhodospirillales bacterium TMPK1]